MDAEDGARWGRREELAILKGVLTTDTMSVGPVAVLKAGRLLTFDQGNLGLRRDVALALEAGTRAFVVNVSAVATIDSYGVAELVACHTAVGRHGGRLIVCAPSQKIREVLAITRLDGIIAMRDSEADAIAELQNA